MFGFFKKSKKESFHIDFELVNNLFNYLQEHESYVTLSARGFLGEIEALWMGLPSSFEGEKSELALLKKNNFENFYEVVNHVFKKANIDQIDIPNAFEHEEDYYYMKINFKSPPSSVLEKEMMKYVTSQFIFVLVHDKDKVNLDGFRLFFNRTESYTIESIINNTFIANPNSPTSDMDYYISELEKCLVAFSEYAQIPVSDALSKKYPQRFLFSEPTIEDFKRAIELLNFHPFDGDLDEEAAYLFENFANNWEEINEDVDFPSSNYFPLRYDFFNFEENLLVRDWKFDPEEMEYFINDMLGIDDEFEYPQDTYSHQLFPYVMKTLEPKGVVMLDLDAEGDSYNFFAVKKENLEEVMELSTRLKLGIKQLY